MSVSPGYGVCSRVVFPPLLFITCCIFVGSVEADEVMTVTAPENNSGKIVTSTWSPRQPVPASDGADLLKTIPGFSVLRSGGSNGDPVLRGMFGSRLNILADGASIQGGCGSRMDTPTSYIVPKSFDTLTVVKGPETVLWGPMGSAGTLRFERQPETFSTPGIKGNADLLQGANGRSDQNLNTAFGNENGYIRLDGNHSIADDYKDGHGQRVPGLWRKWSSNAVLGLTPDDDTLIEMGAGDGNGKARYAGRMMDGSRFARQSATFKLEKYHLSEHISQLNWQGYYNDTDHVMDNYTLRDVSGPDRKSEVGGVTWGSRLSLEWEKDATVLTSGSDFMHKTHRKKKAGSWQDDAVFRQIGIFSELRQEISRASTVITGVRIDHYDVDNKNAESGMARKSNLPGAFARYEYTFPDMPLMLYSGIGHTERFPDYWELFSGKAGKNSFNRINPEKTLQWDSGLQMNGPNASFWASVYAARIINYILFDYTNDQSSAYNVNAATWGGELGGNWHVSAHWMLEGSLNYSWGENTTADQALPQMPPLEGRLGINYSHALWNTGLIWRMVASQHRVALDQGNVTGKDLGPAAGFGVLSWNAKYIITPELTVSAGIDNLFDKYYSEHLNLAGAKQFGYSTHEKIAEPGRTWWLEASYAF